MAGEDWADRVAGWFAGTGLDAWVIQREVADPVAYVGLWLADASETADPARAAAWLDWFDAHKVEAVGFGLVTLRKAGHDDPILRIEDLRQQVQPPLGERVTEWFARQDWLRAHDAPGDARRPVPHGRGPAAAPGGHDGRRRAGRSTGRCSRCRRACAGREEVDPLVLALVGGCDGTVPLRDQLALLAVAHEVAYDELAEAAVPIVAHLVERGIVEPA